MIQAQTEAPGQDRCLECSRPLGAKPPEAPHKKFCCAEHRYAYNGKKRKRAMLMLAHAESQAEKDKSHE